MNALNEYYHSITEEDILDDLKEDSIRLIESNQTDYGKEQHRWVRDLF